MRQQDNVFKADEVGVISVEKGRLPFKTDIKVLKVPKDPTEGEGDPGTVNAAKYAWVMSVIRKAKSKAIVVDDSQFMLLNEFCDRASERGYDKFTHIALHFRDLVHAINEMDEEDKIVYFLHHSEIDSDGREKVKTVGKMLDEKLSIEGLFDIVLYCQDHRFYTQANGQSTAKTPEGMFELEIPNDLKAVDTAIREYYGL